MGQTRADIFGDDNLDITFIGIDFTRTSYIGDTTGLNFSEIKNLFNSINLLMKTEPNKFDINKAFRKKKMKTNISVTTEMNETINPEKVFSPEGKNYVTFNQDTIRNIISKYKFNNSDTSIALVIVVERINKMKERASMWFTFFNKQTHELIFTEKFLVRQEV